MYRGSLFYIDPKQIALQPNFIATLTAINAIVYPSKKTKKNINCKHGNAGKAKDRHLLASLNHASSSSST